MFLFGRITCSVSGVTEALAARDPISTAHLLLVSIQCCLNVCHVTVSSLSYDLNGPLLGEYGVSVEYLTANVSQSSVLMSHLQSVMAPK